MVETALITFPSAGEKTLRKFFAAQDQALGDAPREVLNELARAITERGWVQPVGAMLEKLADTGGVAAEKLAAAVDDLVHRRLLTLDATRARFTGMFGSLSFAPTPHRARLDGGRDVYTHGGMELLAVSSTLLRAVDVATKCPVTGREIKLSIADEQITKSSFTGIAGFMAEWDGVEALEVVAARSPLFANDDAMMTWQAQHPGIRGNELPSDILLWIGMDIARQLGALRFKLVGHHG